MALTPMMIQYFKVKEKCKDCILFFRLGDFYEMFFEDAEVASREIELVLTGRDCGLEKKAPMCGIPYHAANNYIGRLINKGYKVAICEQLEDPALAKGIVERGIIKIITPGTYMDSSFLEDTKNNYIMSLYVQEDQAGICFADISTGDFNATFCKYDIDTILDEVSKYNPSEILIVEDIDDKFKANIKERFSSVFTYRSKDYFIVDAEKNIKEQFKNILKESINIMVASAASGLVNYIYETQKVALSNINNLEFYNIVDYLTIDVNSRRNLEITETIRDKNKKGSLLWVLDKTNTSMGARRLRKWIEQPLIDKGKIEKRLDSVEEIISQKSTHEDLKECLNDIYDIERIIGKISSKNVNAKELISLKNSVGKLPIVKQILSNFKSKMLTLMFKELDELTDIYALLDSAIYENPSLSLKDGNLIKDGYNKEIDELRTAKAHGKEWIAALESTEREITGIKSLKIGYNRVFGYYIEITKSNFSSIPEGRYIRKQTLSNAERYITPELKEMEDKVLGAEEKLITLEYDIFVSIRNEIEGQIDRMQLSAKILSEVDCLSSLASIALQYNYSKPSITKDGAINIIEGRHPVIEKMLPPGSFVSNNTSINNKKEQMLLITGPNMAGKSTYMRQIALIVLMAQIGSFVPAKQATISICDKIFTRIGAQDDLAAGKSTFMVEMWEVSNILKNATNNSLVLLDEVGRGTSTYDGLSIAWAVIEYICSNKSLRCKTLFATHYHELIRLEGKIKGVKNYSVAVKKIGEEIAFLRKIVPGGADDSYGIEVAKLAGLPIEVTKRAKEILASLETATETVKESSVRPSKQLGFLDLEKDNFINGLKDIDLNNMTPIDSLNKLNELIKKAKQI